MKTNLKARMLISLCFFTTFLSGGSTVLAQSALVKHEALAQKLVGQCANIHRKDRVLISGSVRDADLMDEIAVQVAKLGAFPLVTLDSQQRFRRYFDVASAEMDTLLPELDIELSSIITANISISSGESLNLFQDVPSERIAAVQASSAPVNEAWMKRNIRTVNLGNGLYPTQALADQFVIPLKNLSDIFWNGVNVDYQQLQQTGNTLKSILSAGKQLEITSQNGTHLKMEIQGRPLFISDGIISDEEAKQGSPACFVWLPAGEVYFAPLRNTAQGTVVVDRFFFQGKEIRNVTLQFEKGKLVSMNAEAGLESFKDRYDAGDEGKDEFGFVDIGINPNVRIPPNSKLLCWMSAGMITIGHGNNTWAGGENNSMAGAAYHLTNSTLKVDGKVIVDNGILKD